ncbi:hypothetical protein BDP27DRAFT_1214238 [Rhodocollybia butyracea]|uniref:TNase-like domain-containing protein n=1 Tax=Rhodocollybia butyracea TaxID=206335 RepID=A0A9P5Q5I0_9AGAR|nr:hypothetical protein BDP27DRAFT_1214238 [Rhodocollybia butyracea]
MAPVKLPSELEQYVTTLENKVSSIPPLLLLASACAAGAITALGVSRIHFRYFKRLENSDWITPDNYQKKRWIKGIVSSVGDADNFRLYHTPGIGWSWPLKFRRVPSTSKALKNRTIHIRISGVDAPEAAHFGRLAQPYAEESLAWLTNRILGKTVYCQLISRDQYSRVVANVVVKKRFLPGSMFGSSLSLEMLRVGWATTYEQAGAEYGKWGKEEYIRTETGAKALRLGMWQSGLNGETPAEYKRRYASTDTTQPTKATAERTQSRSSNAPSPTSLLGKFKFW